MITTGIDTRVKVQQIIESQLPEFLLSESPKAVDFLKQYYISQEFQGGNIDLTDNLDQYLKLDNLSPEVITGETTLSVGIAAAGSTVNVASTKGFPEEYGLFRINNEVFTYTGKTPVSFTGCVRGFSGITSYHAPNQPEELVFTDSSADSHDSGSTVINLSSLFLKEFYNKTRYSLTPGLEKVDFVNNLDAGNFIKASKTLYQAKGTEESFRILFNILYNEDPKVLDLEQYVIKPSASEFIRREIVLAEIISGNPLGLIGQTIIKSNDDATRASISEVEAITRQGKTYYKLGLFVGFNDVDLIEGTFGITPKSRVIGNVPTGSDVITVDSTVGFGATGTVVSGINTAISYSSKSINQFFGCTGITTDISTADDLRSEEYYYGYEGGDLTKKVELRLTGVLSRFVPNTKIKLSSEKEQISVNNVGEKIRNPNVGPTKKEIFANSWIYNTSSRFEIQSVSGSNLTLFTSDIDKSSLKIDDEIEVLFRNEENLAATGTVANIDIPTRTVSINNLVLSAGVLAIPATNREYDLRRKLNRAFSSATNIDFGNNILVSDIQNLYTDSNDDFYVASNSLPSYDITATIPKAILPDATTNPPYLQGYDSNTLKYSVLSFPSNVPFITGDEIYYTPQGSTITGLEEGVYFVEVLTNQNQIRLYISRSFIPISDYSEFEPLAAGSGTHTFSLIGSINQQIGAQKLLKKYPLEPNLKNGTAVKTVPGTTGMLVNGVEIRNYKSEDKIYSGPLASIDLLNGGSNYDVITPPSIVLTSVGTGVTALVRPVISGSVKDVQVDPQAFDIKRILNLTIEGGNGDGAILEPVLAKRKREITFDARLLVDGGGIDDSDETITFHTEHYLQDGQPVVYDRNGNPPIGVGSFGNNAVSPVGLGTTTLVNAAVYWPKVINPTTIKLYQTEDSFNVGVNTVGFTTSNKIGTHIFQVWNEENTLKDVRVINSGSGYENRQLYVKPVGINTITNIIEYGNHGFKDGDKIVYDTLIGAGSTQPQAITGLTVATGVVTTSNYYQVIKINDDQFRITNAGLGATITSNYTRKDYIHFSDSGEGFQVFKYPDVKLNITYERANAGSLGIITATPVVRGPIIDAYLYEKGTNYGSEILNLEKTAGVTIKSGKDAELKPIITNGKVTFVEIQARGKEYTAAPDLEVVGIGTGLGAKLRAVINENGKIINVVVLEGGLQYQQDKVRIDVTSPGSGAKMDPRIRSLNVNHFSRYGKESLIETDNKLEYALVGFSTQIGNNTFDIDATTHSPIIGWAYDGNPIYGPYGYSDENDQNSQIRNLNTGYSLNSSNIVDRPSGFGNGFFIEDYVFDNSGDLDMYNGRYGRTPEFPDGTYAYFAGITTVSNEPVFPYFIGDAYRSNPLDENFNVNQDTFDFNTSKVIRNTYPYKVSDKYAGNDFIVESNEIINQISIIESTTSGSVDSLQIINAGDNYQVGDNVKFDNTDTNGGGLSVVVTGIEGEKINSIQTTVENYEDAVFIWKDPNTVSAYIATAPSLNTEDNVVVSGLSTTSIKGLTGNHILGIGTARTFVYKEIPAATAGVAVTDIYVTTMPDQISAGSSISIGTEKLSVLNTFDVHKVLRVKRGVSAGVHTVSTEVNLIPNYFNLPISVDNFDSQVNNTVYFNPQLSIGVGTAVGLGSTSNYSIGDFTKVVSTPTHSIYLPDHPFKTNEEVTLRKPPAGFGLTVTDDGGATQWVIPTSANEETVYIINKSKDYVGIVTQVGLTTSSIGIAFIGDTTVGSSMFDYALETKYTQVLGNVEKINAQVAVSTSHNLIKGDLINLQVKPNQSVGVGTSSQINVSYDADNERIYINPVTCPVGNVSTVDNTFNIESHNFKTGDKVYHTDTGGNTAPILSEKDYYVYKVGDNFFKLGETYYDVTAKTPNLIDLTSNSGGSLVHTFSLINPPLEILENNNLVFGVGDASLSGYEFKLFYDNDFKNEFVSTGKTDTFEVIGVGTVGITTTATVSLNYKDTNPKNLFYNVQKAGYISTADTDVSNYSNISYTESAYNDSYTVFGIGTTEFSVALPKVPENLRYTSSETEILKYTTKSPRARGPVSKLTINYAGDGYKKLPSFISIASTQGTNASVLPGSETINRIDDVRILDPGFEYSSDPTLSPEAFISPVITIVDSNTISNIQVHEGGNDYTTAPDLVIVNPDTGIEDTTGVIEAEVAGSSVYNVNIIIPPKGLPPVTHKIFAVNNSNGSTVSTVGFNSSTSVVTATLVTPILGFSVPPFAAGEKIFVEGIQKYGTEGDGFNSTDNGYKFFTVSTMNNTNPATVEFSLSGIATNPGIAKTTQNSYASIIGIGDYPDLRVTQEISKFSVGEKLLVHIGSSYVPVDLQVTESTDEYIKIIETVPGAFDLVANQKIKGFASGNIATINSISINKGQFDISYSLRQDRGWNDNIGKLNEDYQVTPDNDYYQNLSYSVKSSITYEDLANPVNSILHTSGLKNFADVGITSSTKAGLTTSQYIDIVTLDVIGEKRVDTINNFDYVLDVDTVENKSKFLKFKNTKLSPYIECRTNRVLEIDDFSPLFSDTGSSLFKYVDLSINAQYATFLIQARNPNNKNTQISDIVLYKDDNDVFTLERGKTHPGSVELGEIKAEMDASSNVIIKFTPDDPNNNDYDLKILQKTFNSNLSGIGTQSIGFVDLIGSNSIVAAGSSSVVISANVADREAYFVTSEIVDLGSSQSNFVDMYLTHDGTNSYVAEYYSDSELAATSNFIGTFTSGITTGVLSLTYENTTAGEISVRSNIIGIGSTAVGVGTYRFKLNGQIDGTERTVKYESNYAKVSAASTVVSFTKQEISSVKGYVRVSSGSTSALHEVLVSHNETDTNTQSSAFVSVASTSGLGTFSSNYYGSTLGLLFHPDPAYTGAGNTVTVQTFTEAFYSDIDLLNLPPDLQYGTSTNSLSLAQYDAINGSRSNKTSFPMQRDAVPIYEKKFDPSLTSVLDQGTGIFSIVDHFFETGERLIYTPNATFTGIAITGISTTGGVLQSEVYAIRIDKDNFKLAKTQADANAGIGLVFTGSGSGNSHELEMFKKNEKTLLSLDGVIQSPITYTPVVTTLPYAVTNSATIFAVAGISSFISDETIKVDDEYMRITNVGFGTTSVGPITDTGSVQLLEVERAFIGSAATSHSASANTRVYSGGFNIVDSTIYFTDPPRGKNTTQKDESNLDYPRTTFNGRVYLRKDYSKNVIYDDYSDSFNGIGQTYTTTIEGAHTTGIQTGSAMLLMNGIFQTPSTPNNVGNNYSFIEAAGITSTLYTGITSTNGQIITSDIDVNQNQLPRGGMIVSLGSTGGLGVAPLVPAKVKTTVGAGGSTIIGICGIPTTGKSYGISTAIYNYKTGELEVTTSVPHEFREINEPVKLAGLEFTCTQKFNVSDAVYEQGTGNLTLTIGNHSLPVGAAVTIANNSLTFQCNQDNYGSNHTYPRGGTDPIAGIGTNITALTNDTITINVGVGTTAIHKFVSATANAVTFGGDHTGITTTIFPDTVNDRPFTISGINSVTNFTANVGITTIPHIYVGQGTAYEYHAGLTWGSGYRNPVSIAVTDIAYEHKFVSAVTGAVTGSGGPFTPTNAIYESHTGTLTLTIPNHGRTSGNVQLVENSLVFTCSRDYHKTNHAYPRPAFVHQFVSAVSNAISGSLTPTAADYNASTGDIEFTFGSAHGKSNGQTITIANNSLTFRCNRDNFTSDHTYPRTTDPASGQNLTVSGATSTKFTVNVGDSNTGDPASGAVNLPITVIDTNTLSVNVGAGGGAGTGAVVTASVVENDHTYVGGTATGAIIPNAWGTTPFNVNAATYTPDTGILVVTTTSNHGLSNSDKIGIKTSSLSFTCAQDNHESTHAYPRVGDPVDGLINLAITVPAANKISVNVGQAPKGTGGALQFAQTAVGSGYVNPRIEVSSPSYENLAIEGVSRRGIGNTTDTGTGVTLSVEVGGSNTTGIGSTFFTIKSFDLDNKGYNFKSGDVFKPVGLVTSRFINSSSLINDFELTVLETYRDQYSSWNFGEFDYIDSIQDLQDNQRTRFPLYYNATLLSFELDRNHPDSSLIEMDNLLLIFVNGVIQEPGEAYTFDGGTSFSFTTPPGPEDIISIFFYRGTNNVDCVQVSAGSSVKPTVKRGDVLQVFKISSSGITTTQDPRTLYAITASDKVETNLYNGLGIDGTNFKPVSWTKQKIDKKINGDVVYKTRDSIESLVYPAARIIGDMSSSETQMFVDDARFFNYEEDWSSLVVPSVGGLVVGADEPVAAGFTATVGAGGTISTLTITNAGSGYVGSAMTISIAAPHLVGVGIGTTATATATITSGKVTATTITSGGIGYTVTAPPQVIAPFPSWTREEIDTITTVQGYDGVITGIAATDGIGVPNGIKFTIRPDLVNNKNSVIGDIQTGYPIYIFGTQVGHGATSIVNSNAATVATGTTCLDNIYHISGFHPVSAQVGIITCNVDSGINSTGINTSVGIGSAIGGFSWGKLSGFARSANPIAIGVTGLTIDAGLSTYPTIQRRDYGLRDTGGLRKDLG